MGVGSRVVGEDLLKLYDQENNRRIPKGTSLEWKDNEEECEDDEEKG